MDREFQKMLLVLGNRQMFLGGSRRFGYHDGESDLDIIVDGGAASETVSEFARFIESKTLFRAKSPIDGYSKVSEVMEYGNIHIILVDSREFSRAKMLHMFRENFLNQNPEVREMLKKIRHGVLSKVPEFSGLGKIFYDSIPIVVDDRTTQE